jgi:hypothetical protein
MERVVDREVVLPKFQGERRGFIYSACSAQQPAKAASLRLCASIDTVKSAHKISWYYYNNHLRVRILR